MHLIWISAYRVVCSSWYNIIVIITNHMFRLHEFLHFSCRYIRWLLIFRGGRKIWFLSLGAKHTSYASAEERVGNCRTNSGLHWLWCTRAVVHYPCVWYEFVDYRSREITEFNEIAWLPAKNSYQIPGPLTSPSPFPAPGTYISRHYSEYV